MTATSQEQVSSSLNSAAKSKNHVFVFLSLFFFACLHFWRFALRLLPFCNVSHILKEGGNLAVEGLQDRRFYHPRFRRLAKVGPQVGLHQVVVTFRTRKLRSGKRNARRNDVTTRRSTRSTCQPPKDERYTPTPTSHTAQLKSGPRRRNRLTLTKKPASLGGPSNVSGKLKSHSSGRQPVEHTSARRPCLRIPTSCIGNLVSCLPCGQPALPPSNRILGQVALWLGS